jgi:ABC-2 type transport system permease protein
VTAASGNIYDLGYRSYEGPRLGRRHAIRALFGHTLRTCYGIGRGGRSKIAPFILLALATIPAIVAVGALALLRQTLGAEELEAEVSPIRHGNYYSFITVFVVLFCAAQAPEALGRDQRHNLLPLYFSRALRREDYALARFAGLATAVMLFVLLPQLVIFLGLVLSAEDVPAELRRELAFVPAIVLQAGFLAGLLGGISAAVSSFTPRRAYSTTAVVVFLAVTPIVTTVLIELGTLGLSTLLALISPADLLDATNAWLFASTPESPAVNLSDLDLPVFAVAAGAIIVACLAIIVRRFQTIAA